MFEVPRGPQTGAIGMLRVFGVVKKSESDPAEWRRFRYPKQVLTLEQRYPDLFRVCDINSDSEQQQKTNRSRGKRLVNSQYALSSSSLS